MNVCGIICEYNPFHNGHILHIQKAREITNCDVLICVMSGDVVQRGEMAITDKWIRAKTAVQHGCDLVIEIPYPFVAQRGDRFAYGAMHILQQAQVKHLVFGSESNDLQHLQQLAKLQFDVKKYQNNGISYAKALENCIHEHLDSNDMLALFYLREASKYHMTPHGIQRTNHYHDLHTEQAIASASAIRHAFYQGGDIAHMTCMPKQCFSPLRWDAYYPYLQAFLLCVDPHYLSSLFLVDEGMEGLLKKQAYQCENWDLFLRQCTSKRYTTSSIQRTLLHVLTQTTKKEMNALPAPSFLRILAYNAHGQAYLRKLQKQGVAIASTFGHIPSAYRDLQMRVAIARGIPYHSKERMQIQKMERQHPLAL